MMLCSIIQNPIDRLDENNQQIATLHQSQAATEHEDEAHFNRFEDMIRIQHRASSAKE